jgi:hypothetical protein
MTCIVWHKNRLYADSAINKDGEVLHSLTKIQQILTPFRIKSEKEGFVFDDIVHGWSGTGAFMPMVKFVESLEDDARADSDSSTALLFYTIAAEKDLVVAMGNLFEVLLIGEQFNHSFRFDEAGFSYKKYEKNEIVCMGGGAQLCLNNIKRAPEDAKVDVIRAMFDTFYHDGNSGGFIDIWEMAEHPDDKRPIFRRYGLHHEIPKDLLIGVMEKVYPNGRKIEPSFLRRELMYQPLLNLDKENQALTAELNTLKAKLKRYEKRLGIVPKAPRKKAASKQSTTN